MKASPLRISRHLLRGVLLAAGGASLLFGVLFLGLYRNQLENERAEASLHLNRMLQVTWENAMLKRDVEGLRDIVSRLGTLPGIRDVLILAPGGEVRFASDASKLGNQLPAVAQTTTAGHPVSRFETLENGSEVLRSINPVPNRAPCTPCHGAIDTHPVNGVLVIDYDAAPIRANALKSAAALLAAGAAVLGLTLATLWLLLRRHVIQPLAALDAATRALASGNLTARAPVARDDEIGRVAENFNLMADRLQSQMALLEANKRYLQEILDGLPDGVRVIRCADKRVVLANRAFCQQVGRALDEIIGQPCYRVSHGREEPCVPTLVVCPLHELQETGKSLKANHHHQRADGTLFPVEVHAVRIDLDGEGGRESYLVESVRDLGQAVRISHEQRLSELGMLAAGIAHEIHNPLASVRLGVQGLAREISEARISPEQIGDYLELIDQEIDNCIAVTRRLLLLARPPDGNLQLVVLNDAINDILQLLAFDAQNRKIDQHADLPETPLRILGEEAEIRMILLNLVQNAHHAMPNGGTLTVRLRQEGGEAVVDIADTGVGIPPQDLERIFDPFFSRRADGVTGTGLGLTIVKNLLARMEGTITVTSTVGVGTQFTVRLPLAETTLEKRA